MLVADIAQYYVDRLLYDVPNLGTYVFISDVQLVKARPYNRQHRSRVNSEYTWLILLALYRVYSNLRPPTR